MKAAIIFVAVCGLVAPDLVYADAVQELLDDLIGSVGKSSYQDQYDEPVSYGYSSEPRYSSSGYSYGYNPPSQPVYSYMQDGYDTGVEGMGYGKQQQGYAQPMQLSYSPQTVQSYPPPASQGYAPPAQQGYAPPAQQGYAPPAQRGYAPPMQQGYAPPMQQGYAPPMQQGYGRQKTKPKKEKIYVPVVVKKKKKKKMKIITVQKGFYIAGGTQLFGKYKTLKSCEKACAATPTCFSGDFNPWLKKCYIHSNFTACGRLRAHKKLVHFKKVPCDFPESPLGRVMLGILIPGGIEQQGIKSLSECVKRCANTGSGIPATSNTMLLVQKCFGIDYDFASHKCFFHVNNAYPVGHFCPLDGTPPNVPRDTIANPAVVSILLCPGPMT